MIQYRPFFHSFSIRNIYLVKTFILFMAVYIYTPSPKDLWSLSYGGMFVIKGIFISLRPTITIRSAPWILFEVWIPFFSIRTQQNDGKWHRMSRQTWLLKSSENVQLVVLLVAYWLMWALMTACSSRLNPLQSGLYRNAYVMKYIGMLTIISANSKGTRTSAGWTKTPCYIRTSWLTSYLFSHKTHCSFFWSLQSHLETCTAAHKWGVYDSC